MMEMKEFNSADWDGFAGAECPENGQPLINKSIFKVDGEEALMIVDNFGIEVDVFFEEWGEVWDSEEIFRFDCPFDCGKLIAALMPEEISSQRLEEIGFN